MSKVKEIDVWLDKKMHTHEYSVVKYPGAIKAKLVIPVEPEVVEFDWLFVGAENMSLGMLKKLAGRRWKCRFEEVTDE
jgi:hypothetical protein